jgi:excreted virulence factor EspC (type VII ESX diderm)
MDFEVAPSALRRGSTRLLELADQVRGELTGSYHRVAPDALTNAGWAATAATGLAVIAADAALATLAAAARDLGDALRSAAAGYEAADEHACRRLRW